MLLKRTIVSGFFLILVISCGSGGSSDEKQTDPIPVETVGDGSTDSDTTDETPANDDTKGSGGDEKDEEDTTTSPPEDVMPIGQKISINAQVKQHIISPMIQGQGLIYSLEADHIYADGAMAELYKEIGTGFLRYPGGTVTTMYHWDDLNGHGWVDSWNGSYNREDDASAENYMDLDEYMALCRAANCEPMLGINMSSGRNFDRQEDGLNEAIEMLKYCKERDFDLTYIYLDNENHHKKWSPTEYANQINYYVPEIKKYAPNAKLIANWTDKFQTNRNSFTTLLNIAGDNFDYIDVHYYWKWGEASWDLWKATTPMLNRTDWYTNGKSFTEEIGYFNNLMVELGRENIKLAVMEWNIGPGPHAEDVEHTPFKSALMQSEMQMQFMLAGLEIGAMWSTQWPDSDNSFRFLVDSGDNYKPTPSAKVFELYKNALNGQLVESVSENSKILSAAVIKENSIFIYLLNKSDETEDIYIDLQGYDIDDANLAVSFKAPGVIEDVVIIDNSGHFQASILADSLTMIELKIK